MMSLFLLLMLVPDIGRRTDRYAEERWLYAAEPKAEKTHPDHGQPSDHDHDHADHKTAQPKH